MAGSDERAQPELDPTAGIPKPELGVFARPVDQMVSPSAGQGLSQLARALGTISPKLDQFASTLEQRERIAGQRYAETNITRDVVEQHQTDYNSLVKDGVIPASANPFAKLYGRELFGRLAAGHYANWLQTQPSMMSVMNSSTDPDAFNKLEPQLREQYMQSHFGGTHADPIFKASFGKMSTGYVDQQSQEYARKVNERFVGQSGKNVTNDTSSFLDEELSNHTDPSLIREGLDKMFNGPNGAIATGALSPQLAAAALSKAIDAVARDRGDPNIYELAHGIMLPGIDGKMHDAYFAPEMADAKDGVRPRGRAEIVRSEHTQLQVTNQERAEKQNDLRAGVANDLITAQANSATPVDLSPFIKRYADAGMGAKAEDLGRLQRTLMAPKPSDQGTVDSLKGDIWSVTDPIDSRYVGKSRLVSSLEAGHINAATFSNLMSDVLKRDQVHKGRAGKTDPLTDPYKAEELWQGELKKRFGGDLQVFRGDWNAAHTGALATFRSAVDQYKAAQKGPVDPEKFDNFMRYEIDHLVDIYGADIPDLKPGKPSAATKSKTSSAATTADVNSFIANEAP